MTRLIRRLEDDFYDDWPRRKVRRTLPAYEPVSVMEDMSRQMARALNQVQDLVEDIEKMDDWVHRFDEVDRYQRREPEALVRRTESGGLQLALDMSDYKPEDLKIKLVGDSLVVEAESESSGKDSYKKSHFKRWFRLPEDVKVDEIKSKLTDGNRLVIDLPLSKPIESSERTIPIQVERRQAIDENRENMRESQKENRQQEEHNQSEPERVAARR
jgi:HSP20 family molecular chaperone IbpA